MLLIIDIHNGVWFMKTCEISHAPWRLRITTLAIFVDVIYLVFCQMTLNSDNWFQRRSFLHRYMRETGHTLWQRCFCCCLFNPPPRSGRVVIGKPSICQYVRPLVFHSVRNTFLSAPYLLTLKAIFIKRHSNISLSKAVRRAYDPAT